tara:strand:- start:2760 stop:3449 length:690 start_codon:yes stop_codon:yes gene_type:complete
MRYLLILLIFSTSFLDKVVAQNQLVFGFNGVNHPDTLYMGSPIVFDFWIINNGSSNLTDSIAINCETYDDLGIQISGMQLGSYINSSTTLNIGDSLFISINDTVTNQSYVAGDNLIVIWPALTWPVNSDTSFTYLHVLDTNMISSISNIESVEIDVLSNPLTSDIRIMSNNGSLISTLYIYDSMGRLQFFKRNINKRSFKLERKFYSSGIYFLLASINNKVIYRKIVMY